jgi:hypothetical protein
MVFYERKAALLAFYAAHDAAKATEHHVDNLLQNFKFSATVSALHAKYNELPPEWELHLPPMERAMAAAASTWKGGGRRKK